MDEKRIGEIVRKVHQIANESCVSDAKNALATYVEEEIFKNYKRSISCRTIERTFDKYIDGKKIGSPIAENVDLLCKFLGYKDYSDYVRNRRRRKWILTITVSIAFGAISTIISILKNKPVADIGGDSPLNKELRNSPSNPNSNLQSFDSNNCMTWADSLYVNVSCDTGPFSKYGTKVEPLRQTKFENMRKVEVDAAYKFFSENGNPLIWYYKNENSEYEFFTAPGLHPITDETLRKITPYIIQTYVPSHKYNSESFLK